MNKLEQGVLPAISQEALAKFLSQVNEYIRLNPIIVNDPREHTSEALSQKPHLYHPCDVRADGQCPDQKYELPSCTKCPHARAVTKTASQIAGEHRFQADAPIESTGTGSLSQILKHNNSTSYVVLEINGDEQGAVTGHLPHLRRSSSSST